MLSLYMEHQTPASASSGPNLIQLFKDFEKAASELSQSRGEHSAALWAVSDFFSSLKGCLVPFIDSVPLSDGVTKLAMQPITGTKSTSGFGLMLISPAGSTPAYKAPAEFAAAAVKRLPDFLSAYLKILAASVGGRLALALARQFVQTAAELNTSAPVSASAAN